MKLNQSGYTLPQITLGLLLTAIVTTVGVSIFSQGIRLTAEASLSLNSAESLINPIRRLKVDLKKAVAINRVIPTSANAIEIQHRIGGNIVNQKIYYQVLEEPCSLMQGSSVCKTLVRSNGTLGGAPVLRLPGIANFNWCLYNPSNPDPDPFFRCSELPFSLPDPADIDAPQPWELKRFAFEFSKFSNAHGSPDPFLRAIVDLENFYPNLDPVPVPPVRQKDILFVQ
jgi:hypothetical protein